MSTSQKIIFCFSVSKFGRFFRKCLNYNIIRRNHVIFHWKVDKRWRIFWRFWVLLIPMSSLSLWMHSEWKQHIHSPEDSYYKLPLDPFSVRYKSPFVYLCLFLVSWRTRLNSQFYIFLLRTQSRNAWESFLGSIRLTFLFFSSNPTSRI